MTDTSHTNFTPYDPNWPKQYQNESQILKDLLQDEIIDIQHIGSTSIPGLLGKLIIDIGVLIPSYREHTEFTHHLAKLGYRYDSSSTERHFYRKGFPSTHHLSIAFADRGGFWDRQILFRDYLRSHPEARDEYAKLKLVNVKKDPSGRGSYISDKTEFVENILRQARLDN